MSTENNSYSRISRDLETKMEAKISHTNSMHSSSSHVSSYKRDFYSVRDSKRGSSRHYISTNKGIIGGFDWPITAV